MNHFTVIVGTVITLMISKKMMSIFLGAAIGGPRGGPKEGFGLNQKDMEEVRMIINSVKIIE